MAHFIPSTVLYKCPANLLTSMMNQKLSLIEESLGEFHYCLGENKLKRVHEGGGGGREQKELRIVFREKSS